MSSTSLTAVLSQELIDKVIDHLAESYHTQESWLDSRPNRRNFHHAIRLSDLCAASLVCRTFRDRCQFHILGTLNFNIDVSEVGFEVVSGLPYRRERIQGLLHLLRTRRYLAGGPVSLSLLMGHFVGMYLPEYMGYNASNDEDLTRLLRYLRDTPTMQVTQLQLASDSNSGDNLQHALCAIMPFIPFSNISRLVLRTLLIVPLSIFSSCPRLSDLVLDDVVVEQRTDSSGIAGSGVPILQILEHTPRSDELEWITGNLGGPPVVDITHLRILRLCIPNHDFLYAHIAALCGNSVSELHIQNDNQVPRPTPPLRWFTALHTLCVDMRWTDTRQSFPVEGLCEWLSGLPATRSLKTVTISVDVGRWKTSIDHFVSSRWEILDQTLLTLFASADSGNVLLLFSSAGPGSACTYHVPASYRGPGDWPPGAPKRTTNAERFRRMNHYGFDFALRKKFTLLHNSPKIAFSFKFVEYWI